MQFFFPRQYRQYKLVMILMLVEIPFVIVLLTLTGIASHDLYTTLLWQDGADNGFNSSPDERLYAAANYRPYKAPMVWSSFLTNYNLVLGVLAVFFLIVKIPVHSMHLFFPPIGAVVHASMTILLIVSARYQAGSDMSDPKHPQPGPPWYITKKCSVAAHPSNVGYCEQAKSLFALTVIIIILFFVETCASIHSCFITKDERERIIEDREEKRVEKEFEEEILKTPGIIPMTPAFYAQGQMIPRTPGFPPMAHTPLVNNGAPVSSFTPRTLAFNRLGSTSSDLPLRSHSDAPTPKVPQQQTTGSQEGSGSPMYFPPPPKKAQK